MSELLIGVSMGLAASLFVSLRQTLARPVAIDSADGATRARLGSRLSFLSRAAIRDALDSVLDSGVIIIDGAGVEHMDHDVLETIHDFAARARDRGAVVRLIGIPRPALSYTH